MPANGSESAADQWMMVLYRINRDKYLKRFIPYKTTEKPSYKYDGFMDGINLFNDRFMFDSYPSGDW